MNQKTRGWKKAGVRLWENLLGKCILVFRKKSGDVTDIEKDSKGI